MKYRAWIMPIAIVLAGVFISVAIIYSVNKEPTPKQVKSAGTDAKQNGQQTKSADAIRPVSKEKDHILGNPEAPMIIVEYSDTECPFCKQFHSEMHTIVADYAGQVAWVYRHFPLHTIHPKAIPEAEATECAAELGGNSAFWAYLDRIFEITPSNNRLDLALLPEVATHIGLDRDAFQKCFDERRHAERVADDYNNAVESGGRGTPYSIIITKAGKKIPLSGSLPYSSIKATLDKLFLEM